MLEPRAAQELPSELLSSSTRELAAPYAVSARLPLLWTGIPSRAGSSAQTAWPVERALQRIQAEGAISVYLSDPGAEKEAQQRSIHAHLAAQGLITPARQGPRVVSAPLSLGGKALSECLSEVRG